MLMLIKTGHYWSRVSYANCRRWNAAGGTCAAAAFV